MRTPTKSDQIVRLLKNDFRSFLSFAFGQLHGDKPLSRNWHIDVMADRLAKFAKHEPQRMVVNAPPRSLKSFTGSVALPAFLLGRDPTKQIILIVGNASLGKELLNKLQRLMSSPRYRSLFPHIYFDRKASDIQLKAGGFIRLACVGQQISGRGADLIIIDDPLSPSYAKDKQRREAVNGWFETDALTRLNNKSSGSVLLIMQRVHSEDLAGHIRNRHPTFQYLVLSAVSTKNERWQMSDGRVFKRAAHRALEPARENLEQLRARLEEVGSFQFNAQYLQGQYHPFVDREGEGGWFWEVPPEDAKGTESQLGGLMKISYKLCIIHRVFGVPYDGPVMARFLPKKTEEQEAAFEAECIWYQRLLSTNALESDWAEFHNAYPSRPERNVNYPIL